MSSETVVIDDGSRCVFDANVLLYAHETRSNAAQELLRRCAQSEITGILPSAVWAELMHKLMLGEALATGRITGPNPARKLSEHPETVRSLSLYRSKIADYRRLGMLFEPCLADDVFTVAPRLQREYGLLTNDSLILACALRIGADCLVTSDRAFERVSEMRTVLLKDLL